MPRLAFLASAPAYRYETEITIFSVIQKY